MARDSGRLRWVGGHHKVAHMEVSGRWRIEEMDLWDRDALDLVQAASIEFGHDRSGSFGFIAVEGWLDCHEARIDGRAGAEFSWQGYDEGDPVSGRGWAVLGEDGFLRGRVFFHQGDDSGFRATRQERPAGSARRDRARGR
jgi:hypothetical protein